MSSLPKFIFPETLGGRHEIAGPASFTVKQAEQQDPPELTKQCMFVVQTYYCPHHPGLSTPHPLHQVPCPQALLPQAEQKKCDNYSRREGDMVQVSHYHKGRGCISCKAEGRVRPNRNIGGHSTIIQQMQDLGLEDKETENSEKLSGTSDAIKRAVELVEARQKKHGEKNIEHKQHGAEKNANKGKKRKSTELEEAAETKKIGNRKIIEPRKAVPNDQDLLLDLVDSDFFPQNEIDDSTHLTSFPSFSISPGLKEAAKCLVAGNNSLPESQIFENGESFTMVNHDGVLYEEWETNVDIGRVWGEVARAPGTTRDARDEWVVVGSWGKDEDEK